MSKIEVIKKNNLRTEASTPGVTREVAFDSESVVVIRATAAGGAVSGWHHHGDHHYYGYLISGRARLEYGPGGREAVEVKAGEFFQVPPRAVHRDINPDPKETQLAIICFVGNGPWVVNMDSPEV